MKQYLTERKEVESAQNDENSIELNLRRKRLSGMSQSLHEIRSKVRSFHDNQLSLYDEQIREVEHSFAVSLFKSENWLTEEIQALDIECRSGGNLRITDCEEGDQNWDRCCSMWNDMVRREGTGKPVKLLRIRHVFSRYQMTM